MLGESETFHVVDEKDAEISYWQERALNAERMLALEEEYISDLYALIDAQSGVYPPYTECPKPTLGDHEHCFEPFMTGPGLPNRQARLRRQVRAYRWHQLLTIFRTCWKHDG